MGIGELPCIEALTAMHELHLYVADYAAARQLHVHGAVALAAVPAAPESLSPPSFRLVTWTTMDNSLMWHTGRGRDCHRPCVPDLAPALALRC
jgi:hypothetical protein